MNTIQEVVQKKKLQRVLQVLCISLFINLLFAIFIIYQSQEYGYTVLRKAEYKPAGLPVNKELLGIDKESKTLEEELLLLKEKSVIDLFLLLEDEAFVIDGYKRRDLALSVLTSLHHFDLHRAIANIQTQQFEKEERLLEAAGHSLTLHKHFATEHFAAICRFVKEEKYPFTCQGLFLRLQKEECRADADLKKSFLQTSEFLVIETLFRRKKDEGKKIEITSEELVDLVLAGDWKTFSDNICDEKKVQDFSSEKRKKLLVTYLGFSSSVAAKLFFLFEKESAIHRVTDEEAIKILQLLEKEPLLCQEYALALLESKRGDAVWKASQELLVKGAKKEELKAFSRRDLLAHFGKKMVVVAEGKTVKKPQAEKKKVLSQVTQSNAKPHKPEARKKQEAAKKKQIFYTVQQGDNLWKISKKFHVEIAVLKQLNNLQNDALKPGTTLRIPN